VTVHAAQVSVALSGFDRPLRFEFLGAISFGAPTQSAPVDSRPSLGNEWRGESVTDPARPSRREVLSRAGAVAAFAWTAPAVRSIRVMQSVGTPDPTSSSASTSPPVHSTGCTQMNDPIHDGVYLNDREVFGSWFAGETIRVRAGPPLAGAQFRVVGATQATLSAPFGETIEFTFPADRDAAGLRWGLVSGPIPPNPTWTVSCA
jgi:hypothetical protein